MYANNMKNLISLHLIQAYHEVKIHGFVFWNSRAGSQKCH